jgi:hypothetical protein
MKGIDTTASMLDYAQLLKKHGYDFVGRYINAPWKSVTLQEKNHLTDNGIKLIYIYEQDPTSASYFTDHQASLDLYKSLDDICSLEMTDEDVIYYTVDYDAPDEDIPRIVEYFSTLISLVRHCRAIGYVFPGVGVYGSGAVISAVREQYPMISTWLAQSVGWRGYYDVKNVTIRQGGRDANLPFDNDTDILYDLIG